MIEFLDEEKRICTDNKKRTFVKLKCSTCQKEFWRDKRSFNKNKNNNFYCSSNCTKNRIIIKCDYCNIEFEKIKSKIKSKSGMYFCCREHKDLAQKIENNFINMWPNHYNNGESDYRENAFKTYEHKCEICGYNEYIKLLQVHHLDSNRNNNNIENLIILCPNHHALITYHYAIIENRKLILLNEKELFKY